MTPEELEFVKFMIRNAYESKKEPLEGLIVLVAVMIVGHAIGNFFEGLWFL